MSLAVFMAESKRVNKNVQEKKENLQRLCLLIRLSRRVHIPLKLLCLKRYEELKEMFFNDELTSESDDESVEL